MINRKVRNTILGLWLLTILGTACVCLWKYRENEQKETYRAQTVMDMTSQIRSGEKNVFTVDPNAVPVSGEDPLEDLSPVFPALDVDPASFESGDSSGNASSSYTLVSCGIISIPSIDCLLPLWDGAGSIQLRYGAGKVPNGAFPGEAGNLVILGHRMKKYGSLFNRLGEVRPDDKILIETENMTYTYMVDTILTIDPSELSFYMQNEGDACRITLITCTPVGVGTNRLLILGHLISG